MEGTPVNSNVRQCNYCTSNQQSLSEGKLKRCGRCYNVYYCTKQCQTQDWPSHKINCNPRERKIESPLNQEAIKKCSKICKNLISMKIHNSKIESELHKNASQLNESNIGHIALNFNFDKAEQFVAMAAEHPERFNDLVALIEENQLRRAAELEKKYTEKYFEEDLYPKIDYNTEDLSRAIIQMSARVSNLTLRIDPPQFQQEKKGLRNVKDNFPELYRKLCEHTKRN